jgi:hypothetical protein
MVLTNGKLGMLTVMPRQTTAVKPQPTKSRGVVKTEPRVVKARLELATDLELRSVGRRLGRMQQDREQINVRVPTQLKRLAVSKAALSGLSISDLIEELLVQYVQDS